MKRLSFLIATALLLANPASATLPTDAAELYQQALERENQEGSRSVAYNEAAPFLQQAAEAGHVAAMLRMADYHALGFGGLEHSDEVAEHWYKRAAEALAATEPEDPAGAIYNFALQYLDTGDENSLEWGWAQVLIGEAADRGHPEAILLVNRQMEEWDSE